MTPSFRHFLLGVFRFLALLLDDSGTGAVVALVVFRLAPDAAAAAAASGQVFADDAAAVVRPPLWPRPSERGPGSVCLVSLALIKTGQLLPFDTS